ncbi:hypothetical protein [Sphingomonas sanguinis]|uniref:hypothetical protein n=1 Tax=Sphingomonas sanguinis TaxID=33051 RepID=UPI0030187F4D
MAVKQADVRSGLRDMIEAGWRTPYPGQWLEDMVRAGADALRWLADARVSQRRDAYICWLRDSRKGSVDQGKVERFGWAGRPGHRAADTGERQERQHPLGHGASGAMQFHGTVTLYGATGVDVKDLGAGVFELHVREGAVFELVVVKDDDLVMIGAADDARHNVL